MKTRPAREGSLHRNGRGGIDRHSRDAVLGQAVDQFVRVREVDQCVACAVDHAHHTQALEEDGYSITKEQFDSMKNKSAEYYSLPLTQKEFEELSRDEILKKRIEYLKENNLL